MSELHGIYLGAYKAFHPGYDIVYQDINGLRDLDGDMMDVSLSGYDFIIATPPCNYWSRANYRRDSSSYSLKTKHLLPDIISKLEFVNKPYIVENVRNDTLFEKYNLLNKKNMFIYKIGRHTYWTNIMFNTFVNQDRLYIQNVSRCKREGSDVHYVIESWLKEVHRGNTTTFPPRI